MPADLLLKTPVIHGEAKQVMLDLNRLSAGANPAWKPYPGARALVADVLGQSPQGVDGILIGLLKVPGYRVTVGSNGIIAILIGLLLPAVQKLAGRDSSDLHVLSTALAPKGQIAFALGDGSVRMARTVHSHTGSSKWIDVLSVDWGIISLRDPSPGLPMSILR